MVGDVRRDVRDDAEPTEIRARILREDLLLEVPEDVVEGDEDRDLDEDRET